MWLVLLFCSVVCQRIGSSLDLFEAGMNVLVIMLWLIQYCVVLTTV